MITIGTIQLDLPFVQSKKERRSILVHIIDKMKRMNISVMDSSAEYSHEGLITFTFVGANELTTHKTIEKIEQVLFDKLLDDCFELEYEVI